MHQFKNGDRVVHASRPEWGTGVVTAAQNLHENGKAVQRLTLRFDRAGLKTLSTALADLRPAEGAEIASSSGDPDSGGWLQQLEQLSPLEMLTRLPEATTDPFASVGSRLKATLDLYRFSNQSGSLLDWAAMQTGMRDPLTKFSRHELEQFFQRFSGEREAHLKKVLADVRKSDDPEARRLLANPPAYAKDIVRKLNALR